MTTAPNITYQRLSEAGDGTVGMWIAISGSPFTGVFGFGVEDVHRPEKVYGATRIPAGDYRLIKRDHGDTFTRYRKRWGHPFVVELAEVPNYTDVLIHVGNTAGDTKGCLTVATGIARGTVLADGDPMVTASAVAYSRAFDRVFYPLLKREPNPILRVRDEGYLLAA